MKTFFAITFLFLATTASCQNNSKTNGIIDDVNKFSEVFLKKTIDRQDVDQLKQELAKISLTQLQRQLNNDAKRKAFWINIYNAFIIDILRHEPKLYENRSNFFSKDQITIAGERISFDKIEHGILRRSQAKLGRGYVGKLWSDSLEKALRVNKIDYRIHFALNCGANDCPPVAVYSSDVLEEQLNISSQNFLRTSTDYTPKSGKARVTTLFSWFKGDFGGSDGIKEILQLYGAVPQGASIDLEYKDYDWTLNLTNFSTF